MRGRAPFAAQIAQPVQRDGVEKTLELRERFDRVVADQRMFMESKERRLRDVINIGDSLKRTVLETGVHGLLHARFGELNETSPGMLIATPNSGQEFTELLGFHA